MNKFKVTIKKSYVELIFVFECVDDVVSFMLAVTESYKKDDEEMKITMEIEEKQEEETNELISD